MVTEPIFTISVANSADVQELVALVNSAYRGDSSRMGWTTEADLLDGIRISENALKIHLNNTHTAILKLINTTQEIKGCVLLNKQSTTLYLGMLTVAPTLQNEGLGKKILAAAEKYAIEHECNTIEITVISDRSELIAWYERRGFVLTGQQKPFPNNNPEFGIPKKTLHFIVMHKILIS